MNSAVPVTMLAFTFQSRFALHALLRSLFAGVDAAVVVEFLGDVKVQQGDATKLHELKMHIAAGNLTERSEDLWKTLRIWSNHAINNKISLPTTSLFLATTQNLSSASSILKSLATKDRDAQTNTKIAEGLTEIAEGGGNKTNAKSYVDFLRLNSTQRTALVTRILIIPSSPDFATLDAEIARMVANFYHGDSLPPDAWQRLIGWWDGKIVAMLTKPGSQPVRHSELKNFIQEHRDRCGLERPMECFADAKPNDGVEGDHSMYLRQLDLIGQSPEVKWWAKRDFYRASLERDAWTRRVNSYARLLDEFDQQLIEIWERAKPATDAAYDEKQQQQNGAEFFERIMSKEPVPLRSDMAPHRPYITHGSFHLLANAHEATPRIGWHPRFLELLADPT